MSLFRRQVDGLIVITTGTFDEQGDGLFVADAARRQVHARREAVTSVDV